MVIILVIIQIHPGHPKVKVASLNSVVIFRDWSRRCVVVYLSISGQEQQEARKEGDPNWHLGLVRERERGRGPKKHSTLAIICAATAFRLWSLKL